MSKSIKSESDSESSNYSVYGGSSDESDNSVYGGSSDESDNSVYGGEYDFTAYGGNEYDGNEYINYSDVKDIEEKEEKEEKGAYYSSLIDYGESDEDTYGKNNTGGVEEIIGSALIENTEAKSTDVRNTIGGDIQRALSSFLDSAESI
jgi:hypothetical protein